MFLGGFICLVFFVVIFYFFNLTLFFFNSSGSGLLASLKKTRGNLQQFLVETHNGPNAKNLSFEDYLIMPVQVLFPLTFPPLSPSFPHNDSLSLSLSLSISLSLRGFFDMLCC